MKKQLFIIAIATVSLTSCSVTRSYERPNDIKTDGLYGNAQTGSSDQGWGAKAWREFFTDPQLQALIERGLAQSLNMRQLDLQIQETQEYLKCAKLAYVPSLAIAPQGQLSSFDWAKPLKFYTVPLSASWQLGSFGQLRNAKKSAEVGVEQTRVARQAVQQALVANIASMYYTLCMLDAQLSVSEQTAKNWRESVEITRKLMAAGRSNKAAVAQSEANCFNVEANLLDICESIIEVENAMCTILGEAPHHIERSTLASFKAPAAVETGIPMSLLQNRPDVKQAELALANAFYEVNVAQSSFYPSLTLSGTLGFTNNGGSVEINPGKLECPRTTGSTHLPERAHSCTEEGGCFETGRSQDGFPAESRRCRQRGEHRTRKTSDRTGQADLHRRPDQLADRRRQCHRSPLSRQHHKAVQLPQCADGPDRTFRRAIRASRQSI